MPQESKIQYVVCSDFTPGLNTLDDPIDLDIGASPAILNMDITKKGKLLARYGYELVSTIGTGAIRGMQPFYRTYGSNSGDYLVTHSADGNSYYTTAANLTPTLIGAWGTDAGNPVRGATFNNLAIFSEGRGANVMKQWDATTLSNVAGSPPQVNVFGVFQKRMFCSGATAAPSRVNYSDVDALTNIATNFINVTVGDGWDVTAMVSNNDFLQVYKTDTINGINFSFDTSYNLTAPQLQPIVNSQGGAWATDSTQAIYGNTYYLSNKGFETYGPSPERITADRPLPLSLQIEPTVKTVNMAYPNSIVSAFFDQKYICAAPLNNSSIANYCFVYNESIKRRFGKDNWTMYDNIPASAFVKFRNSKKRDELFFGSALENKIFKFNNSFSDAGHGYKKLWTSKTFKFGERTNYYYLDLEGVKTVGSTIKLLVYTDQKLAQDVIDDANFVNATLTGAYVGDSLVGLGYVGGGYEGSESPLYKWKKRFYFPSTVNYGYNMYFLLYNDEDGQGFGLNLYKLAYRSEAEEPTYRATE